MAINSVPPPLQDKISRSKRTEFGDRDDPLEGFLTDPWNDWFNSLSTTINQAPTRFRQASLTNQGASIAATDLAGAGIAAGLYRFTYYARITQVATTSSSLTITLDWLDGGVTPNFVGAAMTGNLLTTVQSNSILLRSDGSGLIRYATTYGSVGATPMRYALSLVLERIQA